MWRYPTPSLVVMTDNLITHFLEQTPSNPLSRPKVTSGKELVSMSAEYSAEEIKLSYVV